MSSMHLANAHDAERAAITEVFDPEFRHVYEVPSGCVTHLPPARLNITRLVLCRNYRAGRPESCAMARNCKFVHADCDLRHVAMHSIHVNYVWRDEGLCTYPRLPPGEVLEVLPLDAQAPVERVPSSCVLRTAATATHVHDALQPVYLQCVEFMFNRMCRQGVHCTYLHILHVQPTMCEAFKRVPAQILPGDMEKVCVAYHAELERVRQMLHLAKSQQAAYQANAAEAGKNRWSHAGALGESEPYDHQLLRPAVFASRSTAPGAGGAGDHAHAPGCCSVTDVLSTVPDITRSSMSHGLSDVNSSRNLSPSTTPLLLSNTLEGADRGTRVAESWGTNNAATCGVGHPYHVSILTRGRRVCIPHGTQAEGVLQDQRYSGCLAAPRSVQLQGARSPAPPAALGDGSALESATPRPSLTSFSLTPFVAAQPSVVRQRATDVTDGIVPAGSCACRVVQLYCHDPYGISGSSRRLVGKLRICQQADPSSGCAVPHVRAGAQPHVVLA